MGYQIELEVSGRVGLFARPDTGGTPTSYPLPTFSACKAMLECVAMLRSGDAWFRPTQVAVCRHIGPTAPPSLRWLNYTTNYGGPLRKTNQISGGNNLQLIATALAGPCYRITAEVDGKHARGGRNPRHYLQDLFNRRLRQGRVHRTPCLGWSEFTCDYWGPFRDGSERKADGTPTKDGSKRPLVTEVDTSVEMVIPSMLHSVWDRVVAGQPHSTFMQDAEVVAGVMKFPAELPEGMSGVTTNGGATDA